MTDCQLWTLVCHIEISHQLETWLKANQLIWKRWAPGLGQTASMLGVDRCI